MIFNRKLHFTISLSVMTWAERGFKTCHRLVVSVTPSVILLLDLMNALQGDKAIAYKSAVIFCLKVKITMLNKHFFPDPSCNFSKTQLCPPRTRAIEALHPQGEIWFYPLVELRLVKA